MANNKAADDRATSTEKDLHAQLKQLRSEMANITSALSDLGSNTLSEAKNKATKLYASVKDNGEDIASQAKDVLNDFEHNLSRCVRKNPSKSVLVAAGIGFVLSYLIRR
ncbi:MULTISPECIES: DUF883 family protein [Bartonella]|uniref:ElaB/YqjD/DUF883 family membrane-anchored ribosome-binding protein n=1 Tax=Bartonella chomelii TaxID=236402 RepID=A0ABR6E3M0_9HYPH|nr:MULTISPECIES: DUF883 family protein [Bartonella]MBA9082726.1 ElaB/YqjD/DUF883 family membrane-anchored ribosome-binding protein [Bartonella chomelii]